MELSKLFQSAKERASKTRNQGALWPAPYNADTWESAWAFCLKAHTWDEASAQRRTIPNDEHLRKIVVKWWETRSKGEALGFEKSRRMVVSWLLCVLDVWDAGLRQCNCVQAGADYPKASDFVWRCYYIYKGLQDDFPQWRLPDATTWGNPTSQHLDRLAFANNSIIEPLNSDAESFRGTGYTRVKLEELSSYRYVAKVLAQARIVTQGMPGQLRGHVVFVCNAAVNEEWKDVKEPTEILPSVQTEPYLEYISKTGNQIIRLHYSADPTKDAAWVEMASQGIPKSEWLREYELYDAEVDDALWTAAMIDNTRVQVLPANLVQIMTSVDPSVSDPERAKNPSKKPDEVGILTGAVSDDGHVYIMADASGDYSPLEWAQTSVNEYSKFRSNRIVAEVNMGGDLVEMTIHQVSPMVPVQRVHAKIGKRARAEPVALAYELGFIHHLGVLRGLENEMLTWSKNSTKSPGRIDALTQLVQASGILENLGGGVAERFGANERHEVEDYLPEADEFNPYQAEKQEENPNPFSNMGWT